MTSVPPMDEPLAHSAKGGIPAQSYRAHVDGVRCRAEANAQAAAGFFGGDASAFIATVVQAAVYHDLGKLDEANQKVLRRRSRKPLPIAHEDAGTAFLLADRQEAAALVAGHHAGLFSHAAERSKRNRVLRNLAVADHVDKLLLPQYVPDHDVLQLAPAPSGAAPGPLHRDGLMRRLALSCLVDADHGNTAEHYGGKVPCEPVPPHWPERLAALDRYVESLPPGVTDAARQRNDLRRQVYDACRRANVKPAIRACDAPVGSGKTTAVMAHLLRVAAERGLRHIFVVLPYTNIIKQAVDVYRRALVLPGERPQEVVAEHHHQADFDDIDLRQLATLWRAPIVVTTAVQFFETLAACRPARLRKLHELPGSAVFVDEAHAAVPPHLWPQTWLWLENLTRDWTGHLVLASGSLARFWELKEFVDPPKKSEDVPDLVSPDVRCGLHEAEKRRLPVKCRKEPLSCDGLMQWVWEQPGPRLVIVNTVQSAAVVADQMRKAGKDVLHLSTALAPVHRERIVERVRERLKYPFHDWALVATSCVEAGMDLSFRTGFRESCSTASLIQVGGRVSRHCEYEDSVVWDFKTRDDLLKDNRAFQVSRRVLDALFDQGHLDPAGPDSASALAKEAMRREITDAAETRAKDILRAEAGMEYPDVAKLCRVIDADTRLVIIDARVAEALRHGQHVDPTALIRHSVQVWTNRIGDLDIQPLFGKHEDDAFLYVWTGPYDPEFLGYMAGVLPLVYGQKIAATFS